MTVVPYAGDGYTRVLMLRSNVKPDHLCSTEGCPRRRVTAEHCVRHDTSAIPYYLSDIDTSWLHEYRFQG